MARRHKKSRRGSKTTLPISIVLPMIAPVAFSAGIAMGDEPMATKVDRLTYVWTGYSGARQKFEVGPLVSTYGPMLVGGLVHKYIGPSVNRTLAKAKVPLIRI
jgi:hypothetical protein